MMVVLTFDFGFVVNRIHVWSSYF